ncbi:MAG TPA: hypothetical protein V6D19_03095 [Stenomitos sp.]
MRFSSLTVPDSERRWDARRGRGQTFSMIDEANEGVEVAKVKARCAV